MTHRIECADVQEWAAQYQGEPFDAVLCDPPYEIGFMGKAFDRTGVAHDKETWRLIGQHLKPGAHLLAFGGSRTYHRLTCAIEDAGFDVRDCFCWLYATGFPKSLDISKAIDKAAGAVGEYGEPKSAAHAGWIERGRMRGDEGHEGYQRPWMGDAEKVEANARQYIPATDAARLWQGYGSALKPAWEPCILAMKPTCGTFAENAIRWGVAGLNVDGGRIGGEPWKPHVATGLARDKFFTSGPAKEIEKNPHTLGRFPANVILDEESARALDEAVGERKAGVAGKRGGVRGVNEYGLKAYDEEWGGYGDTGGPSRFFYVSKASRREREAGLEAAGLREAVSGAYGEFAGDGRGRQTEHRRARNHHPTVKPLALCEYLARLILPPKRDTPRRLLVPFSGSGSEMIGALLAGWDEVVGIEREAEYVAIAEARLAHWTKGKRAEEDGGQMELIA